ncbi:MAG: type VI secretion system Vgr family protein, partial [Pseudomonadota bacterium]|nr:type VI secretion system Vgr family protein [Pseudomonadota bacterium]
MNQVIRSIVDLLQGRQHNRILRLAYPHNDAPSAQFLVNQFDGVESISRDFEYTIELLCDDANVPLKDMHGKLLSIELVRGDGSLRHFTGYVFSFKRVKSDGNITFYEAKLGPWLRYLSLRKDNYIFHNKTLRDQADSIFADYGAYPDWDWRVAGEDAPMTDAYLFDETDFNYLSRRWEAAGYLYWYEHSAEGHKLIVCDDSTAAAPIDGNAEVRFHRHGGAADEDAVDVWSPVRTTAPSNVALTSFNFKHSRITEISVPTLAKQGKVPAIESYEYIGAYGCKNANDGDLIGQRRMEEFEGHSKHVNAEGNSRYVLPGRYLTLVDHFNYFSMGGQDASNNEFLILSVHHSASNNYFQQADVAPHYRNSMTCTRKNVPWRPGRNFNSSDTKILAPQTATVVGPSGPDSIHTDEYGRVRVQFHWDRIGNRDERSSAWVRVSSLWAGAELGAAAIQRVGSEVIVQCLDGNPDRPIITGAVYNELNMPPWELSSQQALMGLRSRELAPNRGNAPGGRSNHLILDDTNGKIQAQLKSDHACSQLSPGHITRIESTSGRKDARGEGWEIATNSWG